MIVDSSTIRAVIEGSAASSWPARRRRLGLGFGVAQAYASFAGLGLLVASGNAQSSVVASPSEPPVRFPPVVEAAGTGEDSEGGATQRRAPPPVYQLLAPAAAAPGQTVIVRGRSFPRRRRVEILMNGRLVARGLTNSIGNFAAGFIVQPEWPRGFVALASRAGGRLVIGRLRVTSRRVRPSTEMAASSGATLTVSRQAGPPGAAFRVVARGLPGDEPTSIELAGRRVASGPASPSGRFARTLRVPFLPVGRREFRLFSGRLQMGSFIDVYAPASGRLAPGRVDLAAAGDIACQPGQPRTFTTCRYADTARVIARLNPTVVAPLGDFQYFVGSIATVAGAFDGTWGLFKDRMRPSPGNHEYQLPGASGYFTYFGAAAGPPNGWYSYNLGAWHVVVLNSNCPRYLSCADGSPQEQWLRADLAANPRACTLAYFEDPRFSSAGRFVTPTLLPIWQALYDHGVDVVLNADAHVYERFAPQNPFGSLDPARGIRQFTVGTGGKDLGRFIRVAPNSERRLRSFGVLGLSLTPGSYSWSFHPVAGFTQRDRGTGACH